MPPRAQAGEGQTGAGSPGGMLTKRPGGTPASKSGGAMARRGPARRPTSGSRPQGGGGGGAGILRFYTDDAPGLKMCAPP